MGLGFGLGQGYSDAERVFNPAAIPGFVIASEATPAVSCPARSFAAVRRVLMDSFLPLFPTPLDASRLPTIPTPRTLSQPSPYAAFNPFGKSAPSSPTEVKAAVVSKAKDVKEAVVGKAAEVEKKVEAKVEAKKEEKKLV